MKNEEVRDSSVLEKYVNKNISLANAIGLIAGFGFLTCGMIMDRESLAIFGGTSCIATGIGEVLNYQKAYYNATLDYMRNGRFTKE